MTYQKLSLTTSQQLGIQPREAAVIVVETSMESDLAHPHEGSKATLNMRRSLQWFTLPLVQWFTLPLGTPLPTVGKSWKNTSETPSSGGCLVQTPTWNWHWNKSLFSQRPRKRAILKGINLARKLERKAMSISWKWNLNQSKLALL